MLYHLSWTGKHTSSEDDHNDFDKSSRVILGITKVLACPYNPISSAETSINAPIQYLGFYYKTHYDNGQINRVL